MTDKLIKKPLSNIDLNNLLKDVNETLGENKHINIFTIPEMEKNPSLFKRSLNKHHYAVLFIEPKGQKIGHWIIMFKNGKNEVYMFDSYGNHPIDLDENLFKFLKKHFPKIIFNTFQYQKYSPDVATCGRWTMFVLGMNKLINHLNVDILYRILTALKKRYRKSYDYIITNLVNFNI